MSRAQSLSNTYFKYISRTIVKSYDAVQALKNQINNLQINPSGERFPETISATIQSENPEILINI